MPLTIEAGPQTRALLKDIGQQLRALKDIAFRLNSLPGLSDLVGAQTKAIIELTEVLKQFSAPPHSVVFIVAGQSIHIPGLQQGEDMSYTVPRDHPDEPFTLDPITASDSEGPVDVTFTERLESSDQTVVSIVDTSFHFGTFGGATVNRIVAYQGADFIVSSVVFNVTPGAITFAGGGINVPGLTPDPTP